MTAGTEVANEIVCKAEVDNLDVKGDLKKVGVPDCNGNGAGSVGGNVNTNGKDDPDDYVFVGDDSNVDVIVPKSDSANDTEQVKKENEVEQVREEKESGVKDGGNAVDEPTIPNEMEVQVVNGQLNLENGSAVDSSVVVAETNGIAQENANNHLREVEVQVANEEVNLENGSAVDSSVIVAETNGIAQENANIHLRDATGEEAVEEINGTAKVEAYLEELDHGVKADLDELDHRVKADLEFTPNSIEISQATLVESDSTLKSITNFESQMKIAPSVSTSNVNVNLETKVALDEADSKANPVEKTDSEVTVDASDSSGNPVEISEREEAVDGKRECEVKVDGLESAGEPTEGTQCPVTSCGPEFTGKTTEDADCEATVDGPESMVYPEENYESRETVLGSEECQQPLIMTSEVKVEAEPIHVEHYSDSTPYLSEKQNGEGSIIESAIDPADSRGSVVMSSGAACPVTSCGPEFTGKTTEDADCEATVDGPESMVYPDENYESRERVLGSEECQQPLLMTSEIKVEAEPIHVEHDSDSTPYLSEKQNGEGSIIESAIDPADSRGSVVMSSGAACPVTSCGPEFTGKTTEDADCEATVDGPESMVYPDENYESRERVLGSEECQQPLLMTSEIKVEAEPIHVEHDSDSTPYLSEKQNGEGSIIESAIDPADSRGSVVMSSGAVESKDEGGKLDQTVEVASADAGVLDQIVESEGTEMSQRETDECRSSDDGVQKVKLEEQAEKQLEESSESLIEPEEVRIEEPKEEQAEMEDENSDSQIVVTNNVQFSPPLIVDTKEQRGETEYENNESHILVRNNVQNDLNPEADGAQSVHSAEEPLETEATCDLVADDGITSLNEVNCCTNETETIHPKDSIVKAEILPSADAMKSKSKTEVLLVAEDKGSLSGHDDMKLGEPLGASLAMENRSAEGVGSGMEVENLEVKCSPDERSEMGVEDAPVLGHSTLSFSAAALHNVRPGTVIEFGSIGHSGIPTSSVEDEEEIPPYNFLIRIPRFEDENLREQIKNAQLQVDKKTKLRDAIRDQIQSGKARLKPLTKAIEAAKSAETEAREAVRTKRKEIDSVQIVINRVKNAISVEDIDGRIYNMEHMIQHETLCLKDEKQFIREIKQLKNLRDQLALNMGSEDEVQQALSQKDEVEERWKSLRKELDLLKDKVSKAEAAVSAAFKEFNEERSRVKELQDQFQAADDIRQEAYAHLNSLKRQLYDQNKNFRMYKDDIMAARESASRGDKDALHRLCANQVETFMKTWNTNDEFRKEYVARCNMNANRRQRTLDGRSLGPDEAPLLRPNNVNERADTSLGSIPGGVGSTPEQGTVVSSVKHKQADNKFMEKVSGEKIQMVKTKEPAIHTLESSSEMITGRDEVADNRNEKEQTREELELAREAEQLRKVEIDAKSKEQRRLDEKTKAMEALERKKRIAEKAQMRAELRAKKEAEQREKEREKRLRKKEKKKGGGDGQDGSINGDDAANSEGSNEATTVKEVEPVKENRSLASKRSQKPPPHFFIKQLKPKPVPPPIINRNKKRWQQWGKILLAAAVVLALFLLGNTGFFLNIRPVKSNGGI